MSLINDALKKAREAEEANASPSRVRSRRDESTPSQGKLVALALAMGGVIIILLTVIIVALLQFFRAPAPVADEPATPVAVVEETPSESAMPAVPEMEVTQTLPAAPESVEKLAEDALAPALAVLPPEPAAPLPAQSVPESESPAPETQPVEPAPSPEVSQPVILEPDPKIAEFIQSIQVRGMGRTKILLFVPGTEEAVAYAEGDAIDCAYTLVIVSLTPRSLVLEDARGVRYSKPL